MAFVYGKVRPSGRRERRVILRTRRLHEQTWITSTLAASPMDVNGPNGAEYGKFRSEDCSLCVSTEENRELHWARTIFMAYAASCAAIIKSESLRNEMLCKLRVRWSQLCAVLTIIALGATLL